MGEIAHKHKGLCDLICQSFYRRMEMFAETSQKSVCVIAFQKENPESL
jgi:hypothetical protein